MGTPFWSGKDAVGRFVEIPGRPERIISLVPSQTELLVELGASDRIVGRTRYCIHPQETVCSIQAVGGTKKVELDKIAALRPDLFIGEKEETPKELVESLTGIAPVYVTDVVSLPSAIAMCRDIGAIIGLPDAANALAARIEIALQGAKNLLPHPERVLYLIWRKPWMAAGQDTFIHACLDQIGFQNAAAALPGRYPELDRDAIRRLDPDRVFLSSEPFPFKESNVTEIRELLPRTRIQLVDGELFSWYGPRMLKMPIYWKALVRQ